ncbi:MAG: recombination regulator RecX [Betaproteobacteria bacterium]|nr:recombination regulator RecX [Burkholderiales bacterium]MBL6878456.1 recombination regulator RecX [Burkholderiales bacterium]MBT5949866.1 recombination regulator RecX [Betaproteobacteria bacterium]MBT6411692.1 recombination regulator RecX [Betaproteobacteria bacterium]MCH1424109.1 recombination regulator RecX [Burkholderiales bacterium]
MEESLKSMAMRLLGRREYTRRELGKKLLLKGSNAQEVEELLGDLECKGWLDDRRYVEAYIRTKRQRFGMRKIFQDLESKGVAKSTILEYREEVLEGDLNAAKLVWAKKYSVKPDGPAAWAKQARFLVNRGFDQSTVRAVLSDPNCALDQDDRYL